MKPLKLANAYIEDPQALDAMWERDGYLFFRDVLDKAAVAELLQACQSALVGMGVVDPEATEPVWNGAPLDGMPARLESVEDEGAYDRFIATPPIRDFFAHIVRDDPFFVPMQVLRCIAPTPGDLRDPIAMPHQDAFHNRGMPFRIAWIPLTEIDEELGGLAVAEGWHTRGLLHDVNDTPAYRMTSRPMPDDAWRRSDYRPGDVLLFSMMTPHSGLRNRSNKFRLSLDLRTIGVSAPARPVIGEVTEVAPDAVTIRSDEGKVVRLRVDEETFIRPVGQTKVPLAELQTKLPVGLRIIAGHADGRATVLRPGRSY